MMGRRAQRLMTDTCVIERATDSATNAAGYPVVSYADSPATRCKLVLTSADETTPDTTQVPNGRATVYLPVGTAVGHRDRLRITHRDGRALERQQRFTVRGEPDPGPVAVVVTVERQQQTG